MRNIKNIWFQLKITLEHANILRVAMCGYSPKITLGSVIGLVINLVTLYYVYLMYNFIK